MAKKQRKKIDWYNHSINTAVWGVVVGIISLMVTSLILAISIVVWFWNIYPPLGAFVAALVLVGISLLLGALANSMKND